MNDDLEAIMEEMNEYDIKYDAHKIQLQYDSIKDIVRETYIALDGDTVISLERCYKNSEYDGYRTYLNRIDIHNKEFDKWYHNKNK